MLILKGVQANFSRHIVTCISLSILLDWFFLWFMLVFHFADPPAPQMYHCLPSCALLMGDPGAEGGADIQGIIRAMDAGRVVLSVTD